MAEKKSDAAEGGGAAKVKRRSRGASFPSMTLAEAVALIKKIASSGTTHTNAAVASILGHQTANSGPYRTKAAGLKDFGLLSGRGDELTVTRLGLEIVHPGIGVDTDASLKRAFRSCKLFATVFDSLPKGDELEVDALASTALYNHGVAAQAKDAFARSFVKSGELAGVLITLDSGKIRLSEEAHNLAADDGAPGFETAPAAQAPRREGGTRQYAFPTTAVVNHGWPISGGTIRFVVESTRPLPATAYGLIQSVIEAGDKLAQMLGLEEAPEDDLATK